ncbi:Rhoptry-associated protein 1 [Babesia duncani]|uniref:Rhoptry-associated protein 1 n=1 Tax=Babesia duncani TaxID=323732 RepID=A0AAD9PIX7_9APIC|nr:Rhoptry-associated protein 1 [Babesia duncani]
MRLSLILKFTFLALPTVLLNNTLGYKYSTPAPIESDALLYGQALDELLDAEQNQFFQTYEMSALAKKMSSSIKNIDDLLPLICEHFILKPRCSVAVLRYLNRCSRGHCFNLDMEKYYATEEITITLMNRYQVAAALYIFRNSGIYETNYLKRKYKKLFRKQHRGYSSYKTVSNALMLSNNVYKEGSSLGDIFITHYLNYATILYATLIYRDSLFSRFTNKFDKFNLFLIRYKKLLKKNVRDALKLSPEELCQTYFDEVLFGLGKYLAEFDMSLTGLASRFASTTTKAFKEEVNNGGSCGFKKIKGFISRVNGNVQKAGATIRERTTGALRGIHRRLTEASDKIRNRFRSRNGNGDDESSNGLLDEDATVEATDDVKPEDDSTGDNEPKEDEITRL